MNILLRFALSIGALLLVSSCAGQPEHPFTESQELGGEEVDVATLNAGKSAYSFYCVACHGVNGDGRGPAAVNLTTPPRDFRMAIFKFTGSVDGDLPVDAALADVIKNGLKGTAMAGWPLPDETVHALIQYIKTFSPEEEGWRDSDATAAKHIVPETDAWEGQEKEAISRGRAVYHGIAGCYSCHPAYERLKDLNAHRVSFSQPVETKYRPFAWLPEVKPSSSYSQPIEGDPACESQSDCGSEDRVCRYGRCETKLRLLPPDFTFEILRRGTELRNIYQIVAAGIPGTAMPMWEGRFDDRDIWALAHYVKHLTTLRDSPAGTALRARVKSDATTNE